MDRIELAKGRDRWRTLVNAEMNLRVPKNSVNFLISCKPVSFSRRTLLHGVRKYKSTEMLLNIDETKTYKFQKYISTVFLPCTLHTVSIVLQLNQGDIRTQLTLLTARNIDAGVAPLMLFFTL
jgi:hypothetical protein